MNRRDATKRKYTRVEDRKDYILPKNSQTKLDELESTGNLKGVLSPALISDRLEPLYDRFRTLDLNSPDTEVERKEILRRSCNLTLPIMNQVIAKFKKNADVYPLIRDDIRTDCIMVVLDVYRRGRFDYTKSTRLTSFLYELFRYAVLGVTSKHFKDKKKFVAVDPNALAGKIEGESGAEYATTFNHQPSIEEPSY